MRRFTGLTAALVLFSVPHAAAGTWTIDSGHSSAEFKVRHLAVSNVTGRFGNVTGTIVYEESDPSKSSVEASIEVATLDTENEDRDKHLKSPDFFDAENHTAIIFKSTKVEKAGEGKLKVTGDLTIRGVTRQVTLAVDGPVPPVKDPWGNTKSGASASTTIDRQEFGVAWSRVMEGGGLVVGNEVAITLEVELVLKK